jgi:hypothetical protein
MVLLPAAVLTLPAYQCLVQVESAEQGRGRQLARAAQLAWWFRHGRSQLARCAGPPRVGAQLGLGSAIEREVCRRKGMQRQPPVARMSAVRLVSARVMLLWVTAVPVEATWAMPVRMTARVVKTARTILTRTSAAQAILTRATLTRTIAAPAAALVLPGVSPSRVERPAQAKAPVSACRAVP